MNKNESKYFNTALKMQQALISVLDKKDFEFITIKEICEAASVNRSTFYLHYDNTYDLLTETIEAIYRDFFARYEDADYGKEYNVWSKDIDELFLITPQYMNPYLDFVKENRKLFRLMYVKTDVFQAESMYLQWFDKIFKPILERFGVPKEQQSFIMIFYLKGMLGVIEEWIKQDCAMSSEEMFAIIRRCILIPQESKEIRK